MTPTIVVVGPSEVSGPGPVDAELAAIALEAIDDELALVGDRPVPVDAVWRDVLASAVGGAGGDVVLVCPSWWPPARTGRVRAAGGDAAVVTRAEVLATPSAAVELARELVVVHAGGQRHVIARRPPTSGVVDAVMACLDGFPDVTIDAPAGVTAFGATLARTLRRRGVSVTVGDDHTVIGAARGRYAGLRWRVSPRAAAVVVALLASGALTAGAIGLRDDPQRPPVAGTWVVEGRVAVEVPDRWVVQRITSGPGSARVQVVSPDDPSVAVHVTQSRIPDGQTLEATAESLRAALAEEPDGVFVDLVAPGTRAGRAVITYREVRSDRRIDWTVLLDGGVRIAIGCQGAGVGQVCDRAVASARAVDRK